MAKLLFREALSANNSLDRNFLHVRISVNYTREFREIFESTTCR